MDFDCSATLAELEAGQGQQTEMTEDGDAGKLKESCHICGKQVMSYFLIWVGDI